MARWALLMDGSEIHASSRCYLIRTPIYQCALTFAFRSIFLCCYSWKLVMETRNDTSNSIINCTKHGRYNNYNKKIPFLSETRKRFRSMLSSMSPPSSRNDLFYISEIVWASDFKIYNKVALDSPYILTGNDVMSYFRSEANRTNV